VWVRHVSGKKSKLGFKTYEQGRRAFEGEAKHFVWCDEEPPMDIYTEILYRLLTTKGLAWTNFTPLLGMSEVVMSFLEPENDESRLSKYVVQAGWKDVPHLDEEERRKLIVNTPPYQIRARTEGEPALGAEPSTRSTKRRSWCPTARFRIRGREPSAWTWVGIARPWSGVLRTQGAA
jgi:phage terminase large subunit-like protein